MIRGAYSDASKARFIVHAGDLVNNANPRRPVGRVVRGRRLGQPAMVASIPTPGNHEYERPRAVAGTPSGPDSPPKAAAKAELSRHWRPQFALPEHGPDGLKETVYYVDYQGVRIVSLNSNENIEAQAPWLEKVLADNPNRWTDPHLPPPDLFAREGPRQSQAPRPLAAIFDRYKVDLVPPGPRPHLRADRPAGLRERTVGRLPTAMPAGRSTSSP